MTGEFAMAPLMQCLHGWCWFFMTVLVELDAAAHDGMGIVI
jgi:hypothetical protein